MAGVNVKMGVTGVSEFKQSMKEAKESVKTLNEQLKFNEAQLKATGDQEFYMTVKAGLLKDKLEAQKTVVQEAWKALESMRKNGVSPTSTAFQRMQQQAIAANTELKNMETELAGVESNSKTADESLENIGKNVSWGNVSDGLNKIIDKLQSGARAAVNFGKKIVSSAKDSAQWADDLMTLSQQTGIDVDTLQRMQKVSDIVDTDVDAIITARDRMARATQSEKGISSIEEVLGVSLQGKNADDLFWEIGEALAGMGDEFDKEAAAQTVFGRSWRELLPLFKTGREAYEKMLGEQSTMTEEDVQKLQQADDAFKRIEQEWQQMKNQFWADNADKITGLLKWIIDNKKEVVAAVTAIGVAFGLLKLGSLAADLMKFTTGLKDLKLFNGGKPSVPVSNGNGTGNSTGTGTGTGGTPWYANVLNNMVSGMGVSFVFDEWKRLTEKFSAEKELVRAAAATDQDEATKKALQLGFGMSESEASDLLSRMNAGGTSSGVSFGDAGVDRMTETAGEMAEAANGSSQSNKEMAQAAGQMMLLPGLMERAVANALSKVNINIDGQAAGTILVPYVSQGIAADVP